MKGKSYSIPEFQDLDECRSLFRTSHEAVFVHDYDTGKIVDVNDAMLEMYGYEYDEALSIDLDKISSGKAPHTIEEANELLKKVKITGEISFEWYDQKKNGEFFWTDNVMKVIKLHGKKRIIVISSDISDRKKKQLRLQSLVRERTEEISALNERLTLANEELRINNEELQEYKNQLEELVAIRTHELIQSEKSLRYKNRLQQLYTGISTRFFNLSPELVDRNIESAIQEVCHFFEADAGFLVEISVRELRLTHLWKKASLDFLSSNFENARFTDLSVLLEKLGNTDSLLITSIDDLPENQIIRTAFFQSGIGSVVMVPILYQDNLVGITGIGSMKTGRSWGQDEISMVKAMGETFFNALKRKKSEITLIESERNYREIFNATKDPMFIHDAKTGDILDVNKAAIQLYGFTYEEALKSSADEYSVNDAVFNRTTAHQFIRQAVENESTVFEWLAKRKNGETFWAEVSLKVPKLGVTRVLVAAFRKVKNQNYSGERRAFRSLYSI
jgi:PAS domain S-box-containing protein